jgi:hypothetical protein
VSTSKSSAIQILPLSTPGTRFFATGFFAALPPPLGFVTTPVVYLVLILNVTGSRGIVYRMTIYEWFAISVVVCGLIVYLLKKLRARRKRRLAVNWPSALATVFRSELHEFKMVEAGTLYRVDFRYSYKAADELLSELFFGRYTEDFHSRDEGGIALMSLTQRPLYVRYNPAVPSEYHMDPYKDF